MVNRIVEAPRMTTMLLARGSGNAKLSSLGADELRGEDFLIRHGTMINEGPQQENDM